MITLLKDNSKKLSTEGAGVGVKNSENLAASKMDDPDPYGENAALVIHCNYL